MTESNHSQVVSAMLAAWGSRDVEQVLQHFSDNAVYHNIPLGDPHSGKQNIRAALQGFFQAYSGFDFQTLNQCENTAGVVMNERSDRFLKGDQWLTLPVMGVFELQNGLITHWRDYFDVLQLQALDPELWAS